MKSRALTPVDDKRDRPCIVSGRRRHTVVDNPLDNRLLLLLLLLLLPSLTTVNAVCGDEHWTVYLMTSSTYPSIVL